MSKVAAFVFSGDTTVREILYQRWKEFANKTGFMSLRPRHCSSEIISTVADLLFFEQIIKDGTMMNYYLPYHFSPHVPTLEEFRKAYTGAQPYIGDMRTAERAHFMDGLCVNCQKSGSIHAADFKFQSFDVMTGYAPQQQNGFDCGIHVILHMHDRMDLIQSQGGHAKLHSNIHQEIVNWIILHKSNVLHDDIVVDVTTWRQRVMKRK